ncbi:MAG: acyl carrier protein [Candidatus Omnitrophota bacterium]
MAGKSIGNLREEITELVLKLTEEDVEVQGASAPDVEANFIEGANVDSLKALEIVAALEKKYKIEIKEDDLPKLSSIDDMVAMVEKLTGITPLVSEIPKAKKPKAKKGPVKKKVPAKPKKKSPKKKKLRK